MEALRNILKQAGIWKQAWRPVVKVEKVAENLQSERALEKTKDKGPVKRALG